MLPSPDPGLPPLASGRGSPGSERRHALPESTAARGPLRSTKSFSHWAVLPFITPTVTVSPGVFVYCLSAPLGEHSQVVLVPAKPRGPRTMPGGNWHLVNTCGVTIREDSA